MIINANTKIAKILNQYQIGKVTASKIKLVIFLKQGIIFSQ